MTRPPILPPEFYARPTLEVARDLIGTIVEARAADGRAGGRIVEVEAYLGGEDPASHAARGRTPRSAIMFGPPGVAYVYFIYGMHHCLNVVTEPAGTAGAVLIRALEPLAGIPLMARRRSRWAGAAGRSREGGRGAAGGRSRAGLPARLPRPAELCGGPGRLCRALGIDLDWNGTPLTGPRLLLLARAGEAPRVAATPRIGVRAAADLPYRFVEAGSRCLSVPWRGEGV